MTGKQKSRHSFTPEEDQNLIKLVEKYGEKSNWKKIAQKMPNRDARQCRDRWNHYLSPNNNSSDWKQEEDQLLMKLFNENGRKWSSFKSYFPRRTAVNIKSRWYKLNQEKNNSSQIKKNMMIFKNLSICPNISPSVSFGDANKQFVPNQKYSMSSSLPMIPSNQCFNFWSMPVFNNINVHFKNLSLPKENNNMQFIDNNFNEINPKIQSSININNGVFNVPAIKDEGNAQNLYDFSNGFKSFDDDEFESFLEYDYQENSIFDSHIFI